MPDDDTKEFVTPETSTPVPPNNYKAEIEAMQRKNAELLDELKRAKQQSRAVPEGVDVEALLKFKQDVEQQQLETKGEYSQAKQKLEEQYRTSSSEKDQRIAELQARIKELEVIAPASTALNEIVHDPDVVFKTHLKPSQIERNPDGSLVVVNGYERTPVAEWAKTLPEWMQKNPLPRGSGAPSSNRVASDIPTGTRNPFAPETYNFTEQGRLYQTDRDLYERLKAAAEK